METVAHFGSCILKSAALSAPDFKNDFLTALADFNLNNTVPRDPSSTVDYSFRSMPTFIPHVDNGILHHGYYGLPEIDVPGVKMSAHYCGPHMQQSDLDGDRQGGLSHPRSKEVSRSACPWKGVSEWNSVAAWVQEGGYMCCDWCRSLQVAKGCSRTCSQRWTTLHRELKLSDCTIHTPQHQVALPPESDRHLFLCFCGCSSLLAL